MEKLERINKYLSEAGVCSRRDVDDLIRDGRVDVDGEPARIGQQIDTEKNEVRVDGQVVDPAHPEKNAISVEYLMEQQKTPWWEERDRRREEERQKLLSNPKSKLLRQGKKQSGQQRSLKRGTAAEAAAAARKEARTAKKAKTFGEALSDKQQLMNVKTRRVDNAVNPKSAKLRGADHKSKPGGRRR
jgi:ribosomal 50S subunit-recycling heat shock protein